MKKLIKNLDVFSPKKLMKKLNSTHSERDNPPQQNQHSPAQNIGGRCHSPSCNETIRVQWQHPHNPNLLQCTMGRHWVD